MRPRTFFASLLLLATAGCHSGHEVSRRILPGQFLATYVPAPATGPHQLKELGLYLAGPSKQGSLRLRLLNAVRKPGDDMPSPGSTDLLASPAVFSPHQLSMVEDRIALPLGGMTLPKEGFFVVVECEASNPLDKRVAITVSGRDTKDPHTSVVLSPDPNNSALTHVVPAGEYPALMAQYGGESPSITYLQAEAGGPWMTKRATPVTVRVETEFAAN